MPREGFGRLHHSPIARLAPHADAFRACDLSAFVGVRLMNGVTLGTPRRTATRMTARLGVLDSTRPSNSDAV